MAKPEILKETPITIAELKEELDRIKKRDGELNFRANKTEEYLAQFNILSSKKADELKEKLVKLKIPRLKEEHISKIIDLMPTTVEGLKVFFQGYTLTISQDNMKKIVGAVGEFAKS